MDNKSQVNFLCYFCKQKTKNELLCSECNKNPFIVEDARKLAASDKNRDIFKKLYEKKLKEIPNRNSGLFWNNHFKKELSFNDQDRMTKDKIYKIFSLLPQTEGPFLDLGFGQGYLEELAKKKGKKINMFGLDISKTVVDRARKKFKGHFVVGDILNMSRIFNKSKFDVILAIEVLEHISPKKILIFLSDVNKSLSPHGIFLISTPLNEHLRKNKINLSGHVRDYSIDILKMELEISGFKILEVHTFHAFKTFYTFKKLLAKIFTNRWEVNNVVIKAQKVK